MDKRSNSSSHSSIKTKSQNQSHNNQSQKPLTSTIDLSSTPRDINTTSRDTINTNLSKIEKFSDVSDNLHVIIRVRPPLPRELEEDLPFRSIVMLNNESKNCSLVEYMGAEISEKERQREWIESPHLFQLHRFAFDHVFDMDSEQEVVYEKTAKPAVCSILEGYNSTIFAYGQTGTGKTFTMEGFTYSCTDELRGIIPRCIEDIFSYIESFSSQHTKFMVRASYLQIYNEYISDLLKPEKANLQIREDKKKGVYVEGLTEWAVRSPSDIYTLLRNGSNCRATSSTKMNDVSSRSHAVFVITVEQMTMSEDRTAKAQIKVGKLNLVDLAGSERIRVTGATGKQLEESKKINKSLSALGNVIYALTDTKVGKNHIPYRDSKLTRLLEDSLGGNCKTTMMAMISPSQEFFNETLSTLHFARRAKNIKNKPRVNEDVDNKALIRQYEQELKKLRAELEEKNRLIHSNELVIQLEEERKRAEKDKEDAINALEKASNQYLIEREEKKQLEGKIKMMNSQMIVGGQKIEDLPQFQSALEERQILLAKEFDLKLQDLEKERQQLEEGKSQIERYKQLLLKQRDIMIALTTKLNERDEAIIQLQEEVEESEKINKELEDVVEKKSLRVVMLENLLRRNNLKFPETHEDKEKKIMRRNTNEKIHVPFNMDKNDNGFNNNPITLLSSEEKISELEYILKEQEKEICILNILSRNNNNGKDLEQLHENAEFIVELNNLQKKVLSLEQENEDITNNFNNKIENLSSRLNEKEEMEKEYFTIEKKCVTLINERNNISNKIKTEIKKILDNLITHLNSNSTQKNILISQDVSLIYKSLLPQQMIKTASINSSSSNSLNSNNPEQINKELNYSKNEDKKVERNILTSNSEKKLQVLNNHSVSNNIIPSNMLNNVINNNTNQSNSNNNVLMNNQSNNQNTLSDNTKLFLFQNIDKQRTHSSKVQPQVNLKINDNTKNIMSTNDMFPNKNWDDIYDSNNANYSNKNISVNVNKTNETKKGNQTNTLINKFLYANK